MLRKIMPLVVLAALAGGAWVISNNPPEVNRSPRKPVAAMTVHVEPTVLQGYQPKIKRFGRVVAQQRTPLTAEASGEVVYIAPELSVGGQFNKGQVLLRLDDARYQAELAIAEANLTDRQQNYAEQEALAEQARQAWLLSGQRGEPGDRVLRKPQIKVAAAQVRSAESSVRLAKIALEKTQIKAPFDGFVATRSVEQGQAISSGFGVATLIADSAPQIEVALHQRDLAYLGLNELKEGAQHPAATVISPGAEMANSESKEAAEKGRAFTGYLIRTAAELDSPSQQLMATVQLDTVQHESTAKNRIWPQVGELVEVVISAKRLSDVMVIPNTSVYQSRYVYLVEDGKLQRREVALGWQDDRFSIVTSGLKEGDQLVITPLGQVASGTLVTVSKSAEEQQL